jgi:hypothetical protein
MLELYNNKDLKWMSKVRLRLFKFIWVLEDCGILSEQESEDIGHEIDK